MKIGFIGLGLMGEPMSLNLLKKSGHPVRVFDFDEAKVQLLVDAGAEKGTSAKDLAEQCDVVFSMVPKSEHVCAVYDEMLPVAKAGQIFIDMSTIDPEVSVALSQKVAQTGALMLDAPVVKSRPAAFEGTLGIYVGGNAQAYQHAEPLLKCIGNNVIHLGILISSYITPVLLKVIWYLLSFFSRNKNNSYCIISRKGYLTLNNIRLWLYDYCR